jgi:hypothetical protein
VPDAITLPRQAGGNEGGKEQSRSLGQAAPPEARSGAKRDQNPVSALAD